MRSEPFIVYDPSHMRGKCLKGNRTEDSVSKSEINLVGQPKTTLLPMIYEYHILKLKNNTCFTLPSIYLCSVCH